MFRQSATGYPIAEVRSLSHQNQPHIQHCCNSGWNIQSWGTLRSGTWCRRRRRKMQWPRPRWRVCYQHYWCPLCCATNESKDGRDSEEGGGGWGSIDNALFYSPYCSSTISDMIVKGVMTMMMMVIFLGWSPTFLGSWEFVVFLFRSSMDRFLLTGWLQVPIRLWILMSWKRWLQGWRQVIETNTVLKNFTRNKFRKQMR